MTAPICFESIPDTLRRLERWLLWRNEARDGKRTKVPYCANAPKIRAAVDNPATWARYEDARDAYHAGRGDGIGVVLGEGVAGVDLDHSYDPATERLTAEAAAIVRRVDSYTEISPSGRGVKIFAVGTLPDGGRRRGPIEFYAERRYFTVTGWHLPSTPTGLEHRTAELAALHAEIFAPVVAPALTPRVASPPDDDDALIAAAHRARDGAKFGALWAGQWHADYPSQSEADLALANLLAFWTNRDAARIDSLFRRSGLWRGKWDERHAASGETYGAQTIAKALARVTDGYRTPLDRVDEIKAEVGTTTHLPARVGQDAVPAVSADPEAPALTTSAGALTEAAWAEVFARHAGDRFRYDHRAGVWRVFDGCRLAEDATGLRIRRAIELARDFVLAAQTEPDLRRREDLTRWAIRSEGRQRIENTLAIARNLPPLSDAGDNWNPDPWVLNTPSGLLDLRTGALRPATIADRLTLLTRAPYDPAASCPRFERFLREIFEDNADLVAFVWKYIGYAITGITWEQLVAMFHGGGANGKGSLVTTIATVLGDYAHCLPFSALELHARSAIPNDIAALVGRRFVIASETTDGTRLNEGRIKALTGCDPVSARFMRAEYFTFVPCAKFILSVNHKPAVHDESFGFWRRIALVPFLRTFPINRDLADELLAESAGILRWAVDGCRAWQTEGLGLPSSVRDATTVYREESDALADFLDAEVDLDPDADVRAAELYSHYVAWADRHRLQRGDRLSMKAFATKIRERFKFRRTPTGVMYLGLRPRDAAYVGSEGRFPLNAIENEK